jgi:hypothetical protein
LYYFIEFMLSIQSDKSAWWKALILCFVSALCNALLSYLVSNAAKIPLYLDTVFTAAICFSCGLLPGLLTCIINILLIPLRYKFIYALPSALAFPELFFSLCVVAEILLICFFMKRIKKQETAFHESPSLQSFISLTPLLLTLVALACIAVSITGGIIDFILTYRQTSRPYFPEDTFKIGLLQNNLPLLTSAILSRIPINIVDRFFVVFGGFGIGLLFRKLLTAKAQNITTG